ncbi:MAG: hypothetical protein AB7E79_01165 [Rhodospirillaceae bacterium]
MKTMLRAGCIFVVSALAAIGLSGCYSDGTYSSVSLGVSSGYGYGYDDGYGYRGYRDRDGDGVPNWADRRPRNPWRY